MFGFLKEYPPSPCVCIFYIFKYQPSVFYSFYSERVRESDRQKHSYLQVYFRRQGYRIYNVIKVRLIT